MREFYTKDEVKHKLEEEVKNMQLGGLYAPLFRRISVKVDDNRSKAMIEHQQKSGTPMCTDGQIIGVDIENLYNSLNSLKEDYNHNHPNDTFSIPFPLEIRNILIHELTHVLCQHPAQGRKLFSKYNDKQGRTMVPANEMACWQIACEIEANRGYGIEKNYSTVYAAAVTEDDYPDVKNCKYLVDIYQKLLDAYKNDITEDMKKIMDAVKNQQEKESKAKNEGEQNAESKEGSNPGQKPGLFSQGNGQEKLKLGENQTDQRRREALKKLLEETMPDENGDEVETFNPDAPRNHETIFDRQGCAYSHGGDDVDGTFDPTGKSDYELLEEEFKEWQGQNVKKAMAKLKGTVFGKVSKNRMATYSRQARRDTSDGLLKKGHKREPHNSPRILLALDKSGSMSQTSTQRATEAVAEIFDTTGRPTEGCWICLHDGTVHGHYPMKKWKEIVSSFYPNGGNDFSKVIRLANKLDVDVVLNVGDGGDYTSRDLEAARAFERAGRQWFDVSIVNIGRKAGMVASNREFLCDLYRHDKRSRGLRRHYIDLSGCSEGLDAELDKIFEGSK